LESHVLRQLPATAGENGEYPEIRGWGTKVSPTSAFFRIDLDFMRVGGRIQ
jgi:hypothetical protein